MAPQLLPEVFYFDGLGALSWTDLPGIDWEPIRMDRLMGVLTDAIATAEYAEHSPAPQVTAPLPVFTPKRAKPAMVGLMVEHGGRARGIGFCAE